MRLFQFVIPLLIVAFTSCSTTKSIVEKKTFPEFQNEVIRTVLISDIQGEELFDDEKVKVQSKFLSKLKDRYKSVAFSLLENTNEQNVNIMLKNIWQNYIYYGEIDPVDLFDLSEILKTNAVLQVGVIDVDKIYGEHRKAVSKTTAKVRFALFSLKSGKILWEATVYGTQENAHSDQVIPKAIEAVYVALNEVEDDLPF